jgi:hypothetical protein
MLAAYASKRTRGSLALATHWRIRTISYSAVGDLSDQIGRSDPPTRWGRGTGWQKWFDYDRF